MLYSPHPDRMRYIFTPLERTMWQNFFTQVGTQNHWRLGKHAHENICISRASMEEFEKLKAGVGWHVWALEIDVKTAIHLKPKLVLRYPSVCDDEWLFGSVVAVGEVLSVVTLFRNENLV